MNLNGRIKRLEKTLPQPQGISLAQMMAAVQRAEDEGTPAAAAERDALSEQFLAQHGIEPAAEIIVDKVERELERRVAQIEGRQKLPNGLKLLKADNAEGNCHERKTDTRP
jgi:hypothetical protein